MISYQALSVRNLKTECKDHAYNFNYFYYSSHIKNSLTIFVFQIE